MYVTLCCGFPPGSETDRNGLSMLSNELSPAQSPSSKVRTQLLIGRPLDGSVEPTCSVSRLPFFKKFSDHSPCSNHFFFPVSDSQHLDFMYTDVSGVCLREVD